MKRGFPFALFFVIAVMLGAIGCAEKPASMATKDKSASDPEPAPEIELTRQDPIAGESDTPVLKLSAAEASVEEAPLSTITSAPETTLTAPEPEVALQPQPKLLDPATRARVHALESQIEKLSENLENARTTVTEAKAFHIELAAIYKAEEKKLAAEKAERVFERMRRSSCGG